MANRTTPLQLDAVVIGERPPHDLLKVLRTPLRSAPFALIEAGLPPEHGLAPEEVYGAPEA